MGYKLVKKQADKSFKVGIFEKIVEIANEELKDGWKLDKIPDSSSLNRVFNFAADHNADFLKVNPVYLNLIFYKEE